MSAEILSHPPEAIGQTTAWMGLRAETASTLNRLNILFLAVTPLLAKIRGGLSHQPYSRCEGKYEAAQVSNLCSGVWSAKSDPRESTDLPGMPTDLLSRKLPSTPGYACKNKWLNTPAQCPGITNLWLLIQKTLAFSQAGYFILFGDVHLNIESPLGLTHRLQSFIR